MTLPKPTGAFEWVQEPWGASLRCRALDGRTRHLFSSRQLPLEGVPDEDREGWQALARSLDIELRQLVRLRQVHSAGVIEFERGDSPAQIFDAWPQADAAITRDADLGLSVRAADCVPALILDPRTNAVGAVHAGWRGTAAGAAVATVEAMSRSFGSRPSDLIAAVGPSIGPCCYEVGPELREQFSRHDRAESWFTGDERPRLDLWKATRDQLEAAGLQTSNVHVCGLCTAHHPGVFHSYRRDGATAGRLVAAIRPSRNGPDKTP